MKTAQYILHYPPFAPVKVKTASGVRIIRAGFVTIGKDGKVVRA